MKIHQLPQGARFEYEGEEYVKTGPLFATGKAGQRLIPRYAILKPLDAIDSTPTQRDDSVSRAVVLAACDGLIRDCSMLVPADRQPALEAARERFLKTLA